MFFKKSFASYFFDLGGEKYWKLTDTVANKVRPWKSWSPPRTNARAVDVEMTSYVLLGYNTIVDTVNGIRVLRWLGNQRNPNGGFISTQVSYLIFTFNEL